MFRWRIYDPLENSKSPFLLRVPPTFWVFRNLFTKFGLKTSKYVLNLETRNVTESRNLGNRFAFLTKELYKTNYKFVLRLLFNDGNRKEFRFASSRSLFPIDFIPRCNALATSFLFSLDSIGNKKKKILSSKKFTFKQRLSRSTKKL